MEPNKYILMAQGQKIAEVKAYDYNEARSRFGLSFGKIILSK